MFVQTQDLSKHFRGVKALDRCTLGIERGEVFGLLGPNGAGKTTLLRLLLGYMQPTSGTATIDTLDCRRESLLVRGRVSYLPGEARPFRNLRARDALAFFAQLRGDSDLTRSLVLAERLGLDLSRPVVSMSTGMRQKLALSIALAPRVPLIILDEPTSSLDPSIRQEVSALVGEVRDEGSTVIFSSHVLPEVEAACDRVAILRTGQLVHTQLMADLRRQHRITAELTGKLPAVPDALAAQVQVDTSTAGEVTIHVTDELQPLLGWLATLPIKQIRIEPSGLQSVYDQYHRNGTS